MKRTRTQSGFTLIELLVVIVILGILAAIVVGLITDRRAEDDRKNGVPLNPATVCKASGKSDAILSPTAQYSWSCVGSGGQLSEPDWLGWCQKHQGPQWVIFPKYNEVRCKLGP